jgi:hypothetical protein
LAAASRMAACLTASSAPRPRSAATSDPGYGAGCRGRNTAHRPARGRSLPARRLILVSRSCSIRAGCTLDKPERARRGFSRARRLSETSIGVEAAGIFHQGTEEQRLATGAGTEDRPPSRRASDQPDSRATGCLRPGPQKRRFRNKRVLGQCRLCRADERPVGDSGPGTATMSSAGKLGEHRIAIGLHGIDPQIEWRRLVQPLGQLDDFVGAELCFQRVVQPVRQIATDGGVESRHPASTWRRPAILPRWP